LIVKENISQFKKGLSDSERRQTITGEWPLGKILVRFNIASSYREIWVYLGKKDNIWIKVFKLGTISRNYKNISYASFIFNIRNNHETLIRLNSGLREPNIVDKKLIEESYYSGKYKKYIDLVEEETGVKVIL